MRVFFIVGPTASGKSSLALDLALKNQGVIINCDSVQVYSHVQIGAAKPSKEELKQVPHYLYGEVQPPIEYTAGMYYRDFFQLLKVLNNQNIENIYVVGGTGFYFQAIEKGMYEVQESSKDKIEALEKIAATEEGYSYLLNELEQKDPECFKLFHPNDRYRVLRAIEILHTSGLKPSELKKEKSINQKKFPYPLTKIGINLDRAYLHQRIQNRVKKMLELGLIEEVIELQKLKLHQWAPLKSVGYKEVQSYLAGEIKTLAALEEQILISTRQLAKRQITWFKRDREIKWENRDIIEEI